jgi:hypothetical protein
MPGSPRDPSGRDASSSDDIRQPISDTRRHEIEEAIEAYEEATRAAEDEASDDEEASHDAEVHTHDDAQARAAAIDRALDAEESAQSLEPSDDDLVEEFVAHQREEAAHLHDAIVGALDDRDRAEGFDPPIAELIDQAEAVIHGGAPVSAPVSAELARAVEDAEWEASLDPDEGELEEVVEASRHAAQQRIRDEVTAALDNEERGDLDVQEAPLLWTKASPSPLSPGEGQGARTRITKVDPPREGQGVKVVSPGEGQGVMAPLPPAAEAPMSDAEILAALVAAHDGEAPPSKPAPAPAPRARPAEKLGARRHDEFGRTIPPKSGS